MFVLKYYPNIKRSNNCQGPFRHLFNELALAEVTSTSDLLSLYRHKIESFDEKYCLSVQHRFFKIWVRGKIVDLNNRFIEKEKKDALLARYLLALGAEIFQGSDLVEMYSLIANRIFLENSAFGDGMKIIHKIVMMATPELFRIFIQIGFDLTILTNKGDKFIPRRFN